MNKLLWNNALFVLLVVSVLFNSGCLAVSPVAPTAWEISPTAISAGSRAFTLTVRGRNFNSGDTVVWNGVNLATNLVGGKTAQAVVPATAVANPGTAKVAMRNSRTGQISPAVTFTITQASYATPAVSPAAVSGSRTAPLPHSVTLSWQPSTATVSFYNVYRAGTSGGPYARLYSVLDSTATFSDTSVQSGLSYYYVVTSVDSTGLESGYSNQAAVVVPTP